jgi:hypothetical protein
MRDDHLQLILTLAVAVGVAVAVFGPPHLSTDVSYKDDNVLHIAGIFPIGGKGGWQGGQVTFLQIYLLKTNNFAYF